MKSIKKFLAVILSMTLMLTLGTATFGAQKTLPSGKDTGSINVTNLKPGDTVTAYQFVKADYNEYGFTGYSAINNYVKDPVAPTAQEVSDMASNAATMTVAAEKKVATGDTEVTLNGLPVGYYLVMVTSGSETVYSPMIAGIYYSKSATDNTLTNGAISADSDFEIKAQKCWAKSSTPKLEKTMGNIDWTKDAVSIERLVRGLNPWPSAYTILNGKTMKIWQCDVLPEEEGASKGTCGEILEVTKKAMIVQTGEGRLALTEIQLAGKARMDAGAFLRGYKIEPGTVLKAEQE